MPSQNPVPNPTPAPNPKQTPNPTHPNQLPRLHPTAYRSDAAILWTHTIHNRATGWLTPTLHQTFRELTLHTCSREKLFVPVYVLMPDHIHMLIIGLDRQSDQRNGIAFLRRHLEPKLHPARFQPQPHDHVLRSEERTQNAFLKIAQYILLNPVRAQLVDAPAQYDYTGCILPGYPDLTPTDQTYWPKFWKIYTNSRNPNCAEHVIIPGVATKRRLVTSSPTQPPLKSPS